MEFQNVGTPLEIRCTSTILLPSVYTSTVYGRQQNWGQRWGSRGYICEWQVGTSTEV